MPASYPTLAAAAGTTISISTTAPYSHDAAGFGGILDWNEVGYITSPGGLPRPVRSFKEVPILSGTTLVIPQTERMEDLQIEAVFQGSDAGQAAVEAASDGETLTFWRWVMPDGTTVYCTGYTTGYAPTLTGSEDEVGASWTIKPIFDEAGVGPVRVSA